MFHSRLTWLLPATTRRLLNGIVLNDRAMKVEMKSIGADTTTSWNARFKYAVVRVDNNLPEVLGHRMNYRMVREECMAYLCTYNYSLHLT